ncbi:sugar ABC transporter permease [Paenibacillus sp. HN-1]|uniref:carbohydrate ABC transporter permease n=2 Tax=Paenibacillus TaxID=44249 RepID=UPI001CAA32CB|nr:sugar ABC transporter permease [Paenibacillus sp. CGMCC 1.18879]MBY9081518.1 sugar ABC transporter permease [Paenibacillus sp. CGMCC 1.18879]MBY9087641.1 sugar ABC transporter permease [Paenibacillus sinensis]
MRKREGTAGYLFFLPGFMFFSVFILYPLIRNFIYSFYDFRLTDINHPVFTGITNYKHVLSDSMFWISLRNILVYGLISVPGQMIFGFLVAYALHQNRFGIKLFRVVYFLPVITSWVVASLIFKFVFMDQGFLNYVITDVLHLTGETISWLSDPGKAMFVIGALGIWKGIGWVMVIYLAALQGVPKDLYEAAALDGASTWEKIRYVTLPSIRNTTFFIQMMLIIGAFNVFTSIYLITDGGPLHQTEVMLTWMYEKAFTEYDLGYASALSYVFAVIIAGLTAIQFRLNRQN